MERKKIVIKEYVEGRKEVRRSRERGRRNVQRRERDIESKEVGENCDKRRVKRKEGVGKWMCKGGKELRG